MPCWAQSACRALTFSLDLEHADGIFGAEAAELAGRERVSAAPRPRGVHVGRPEKRSCAQHRHGSELCEEAEKKGAALLSASERPGGLSRVGIYSLRGGLTLILTPANMHCCCQEKELYGPSSSRFGFN